MYVVEGEVRIDTGADSVVLTAGGVASLPHGVPHVFQVLSESARMFTVASGRRTAPSFDRFVAEWARPPTPGDFPTRW